VFNSRNATLMNANNVPDTNQEKQNPRVHHPQNPGCTTHRTPGCTTHRTPGCTTHRTPGCTTHRTPGSTTEWGLHTSGLRTSGTSLRSLKSSVCYTSLILILCDIDIGSNRLDIVGLDLCSRDKSGRWGLRSKRREKKKELEDLASVRRPWIV